MERRSRRSEQLATALFPQRSPSSFFFLLPRRDPVAAPVLSPLSDPEKSSPQNRRRRAGGGTAPPLKAPGGQPNQQVWQVPHLETRVLLRQ